MRSGQRRPVGRATYHSDDKILRGSGSNIAHLCSKREQMRASPNDKRIFHTLSVSAPQIPCTWFCFNIPKMCVPLSYCLLCFFISATPQQPTCVQNNARLLTPLCLFLCSLLKKQWSNVQNVLKRAWQTMQWGCKRNLLHRKINAHDFCNWSLTKTVHPFCNCSVLMLVLSVIARLKTVHARSQLPTAACVCMVSSWQALTRRSHKLTKHRITDAVPAKQVLVLWQLRERCGQHCGSSGQISMRTCHLMLLQLSCGRELQKINKQSWHDCSSKIKKNWDHF